MNDAYNQNYKQTITDDSSDRINYKKLLYIGLGIVLFIIIVIVSMMTASKANKNKKCNHFEEIVLTAMEDYVTLHDMLKDLKEDEKVTVSLDSLYEEGLLKEDDMEINSNICSGEVTFIGYQDSYLKYVDLKNCGYCSTDERYTEWKETDKMPKGHVMVIPETYYNYANSELYNTPWTSYLKPELISTEVSQYGNYLPLDEEVLPSLPKNAIVENIVQEKKTYYSYRDKEWLFYQTPNSNYSGFSSEQPKGYANKDERTGKNSEYSAWSPNYPDEKSYRTIEEDSGYKWYYKKDGKEIYWNNGAYAPEAPDDKYTEHTKDEVRIYRYSDKQWLWYNGVERGYSWSYYSEMPERYRYRDDAFLKYTDWSSYEEESYLNNRNKSYREERTLDYSRYRIQYRLPTTMALTEALKKEAFEKEVGKTVEEIEKDQNILLEKTYRYRYRKVK